MRQAVKNLFGGHHDSTSTHHGTTGGLTKSTGSNENFGLTQQTTVTQTTAAPTTVLPVEEKLEVLEKAEVVQETIKPVTVEHVQPVVDVHREQTEIHQVMQPVHLKEEKPVQLHKEVLPTAYRETHAEIPYVTLLS